MPNYFQLLRKTDGAAEVLQTVDKLLCEHFQVEVHAKYWFHDWYDFVGFKLACGESFEEIRQDTHDATTKALTVQGVDAVEECAWRDRMLEVVDFLAERYKSSAWR